MINETCNKFVFRYEENKFSSYFTYLIHYNVSCSYNTSMTASENQWIWSFLQNIKKISKVWVILGEMESDKIETVLLRDYLLSVV